MMDYSHIHSLLKGYKTGIKIRFEYNLRNWRHKLGIPLKTCDTSHSSCCCTNTRPCDNIVENSYGENTIMNTTAVDCNDAKRQSVDIEVGAATKKENLDEHNNAISSPHSVYSNNSLINMLNSDDVFNFGPITESANDKTNNTDNEIDISNVPLQALGELLSDCDNVTPKFPSKNTPEKYTVNLKLILKMSGARAATIVKFYKEKNRLTNVHRSQLIQLVVDYFIENNYHLSLNLSHNLEWEIIKMFPTEKLEYYRTEKRGKIYAKFSNMKRYKRERSLKSITEAEIMHSSKRRARQKSDEDNWYPTAEPEIVVKEENENGDENE